MVVWGLLFIFVFLSVFYSYWFLIVVAILGLWKTLQFWFYKSRPWRRIHYPAMRLYSSIAGYEAGEAENENRMFNFKNALSNFIRALRPDWESDNIESFIDTEFERSKNFEDRKLIKKHILTKKRKISESQIDNNFDEFLSKIDPLDRAWMVRMIIAGIIEDQYGQDDRGEYLYEVIVGNAK